MSSLASERPFDPPAVRANLVLGGLLASEAHLSLEEYAPTFLRRDPVRRWHYRVKSEQEVVCHLIVGRGLSGVRARAEAMAAACPELICRPLLFWEKEDGLGFLCLEHFEGELLDTLVEQGRCTTPQWLEHVRQTQTLLERTRQPSTDAQLIQEVHALVDAACAFPGFTEFDARLMREIAQPAILAGALSGPLSQRWSNGDFVGRNLLVNGQGELRLIDYEYAEPTHFSSGDWLRLMKFSTLPAGLDENTIPEIKAARQPSNEIRCWVHHLSLLKHVDPIKAVTQHIADTVSWLFRAIDEAASDNTAKPTQSLLITLAGERQHRMDALLHESATWAKSLEMELRSAKEQIEKLTCGRTEPDFSALSQEIKLRHDLAATAAEANAATASISESLRRAEAAESEASRLTFALKEAQLSNESLLQHTGKLQAQITALTAARQDGEGKLLQREHELNELIAELKNTRQELARYDRQWLCRLLAKGPASKSIPHSPA